MFDKIKSNNYIFIMENYLTINWWQNTTMDSDTVKININYIIL